MSRSSSSSWVRSSRAMLSSSSARWRCMASAWRWASWCSRSASGVSDTRDRSRASSAASARCASCSSATRRSSRSWRRRADTSVRRRSTRDLDIAGSVRRGRQRPGSGRATIWGASLLLPPSQSLPRRRDRWRCLRRVGRCGPARLRPDHPEPLDPSYLVHVLGGGGGAPTRSDPPTSGPHAAGPGVEGVRADPLPRPVQVGILERGDVLLQHRPDLPATAERADSTALAGRRSSSPPTPTCRPCRRHGVDVHPAVHRRRRRPPCGRSSGPTRARVREAEPMTTDAWGIDDGWDGHERDGTWHPVDAGGHRARPWGGTGERSRPAGVSGGAPWSAPPPPRAAALCVLEDGTDLGERRRLPPDLPLGIHSLTAARPAGPRRR